jgi:hypothetical protein
LATWLLLAASLAACVAHDRVPECRGAVTPINVGGVRNGDQ